MPDTRQTSASFPQRGGSHTLHSNTPKTKIAWQHLKIKPYRNTKHDYCTRHSPSSKANRSQPLQPPISQFPPPRGQWVTNSVQMYTALQSHENTKDFSHPSSPYPDTPSSTFVLIDASTQLSSLCSTAAHHPTVTSAVALTFITCSEPPCWLIYWL